MWEEDNLKCGLCLNTYKNPKFLPCYHTFCEGCLVNLDQNRGDRPLQCPQCRQRVQLPPGGVSQLQTNFYITPLLNPERCQLHRTEKLRFYCTQCSTAICLDCKLTDHDKHEAQDLGKAVDEAKTKLKKSQKRLAESESTLNKQLVQVQENITFYGYTHEDLIRLVDERVEQITLMATECRDDLVKELATSLHNFCAPMHEDERCVQERLSTVRGLQQEVTQRLQDAATHTLVTLTSDMHTGRSGQRELDLSTADLSPHNDRPALLCDDECVQRDIIRKYLGQVVQFQPIPIEQSVRIREVFRCCEDTRMYVHAICVTRLLSDVHVAYGASETGGKGWVAKYTRTGKLKRKSSAAVNGTVGLTSLNGAWVRVEGMEFTVKDMITKDSFKTSNDRLVQHFDVYNKGDARSLLRVHRSGVCDLRSVTQGIGTTTDSKVSEVSAKDPTAMDVSRDGRLIAVLERRQNHVLLYRQGKTDHYAVYRGSGQAFRPHDICFYFIGGEERLVVADWLNDVLHVVDVKEGSTLIGHVGGECPVLVKPTALYPDGEGGLWIGCQGGHLLILTQP